METIKSVVIWLLFSILLLVATRQCDYYSALAEVKETSCESITFITEDGYEYIYDKSFDFAVGDIAVLTMNNVKSGSLADDKIIKAKRVKENVYDARRN